MNSGLKNQVEKILDESTGKYTDVIVQFKSEQDKWLTDLLQAAVETERNRSMTIDPNDILPPEANAFGGGRSARRKLKSRQASLVANIALENALSAAGKVLSRGAVPAVAKTIVSFLDAPEVKSAVSKIKSNKKNKSDMPGSPLPNINGARLMVGRDDLQAIVNEQQSLLEGVYENARIKPPHAAETDAKSLAGARGNFDGTTWGLEQTGALSAWSTFGTRGERADGTKIRVAVLDTGVDPSHPDIAPRLVDFAEMDSAGQVVSQGVANARDSGRHGTHVAGTVVGGDSSGGWIGMAPDAELIGGLVLDGGNGGTLAQVIGGIDWAVSAGAHVINMSLGGLTFSSSVGTPYQRAIINALARGTLVVAAIGNDGHQTTGAPGNDYFSLAIGAHDIEGRCAGFSGGRTHQLSRSNFINRQFLPLVYSKPDLSAPGVNVKSCVPRNRWTYMSGTSMATPHVAGAAALLFAATDLVNQSVSERAFIARDLLLGGVNDSGEAGQDQRFGYGTLNVLRSIDKARKRGF